MTDAWRPGIPAGGAIGDVLVKAASADGVTRDQQLEFKSPAALAASAAFSSRFATGKRPADYGALGDGQYRAGIAAITSGSAVLTASSGVFTSADVGKLISVWGAGAAGTFLNTTIASYQSPTQVTLSATAGTTVTGENMQWATDDTAALAAWLAAIGDADSGFCPRGIYGVTSTLALGNYSPPIGRAIHWDNVRFLSHVTNAPVLDMNQGWEFTGRLTISCSKATGSIGVRYGASTRHTNAARIDVFYAGSAGVQFRSAGSGQGVYYNRLGYTLCRYGLDKGIEFVSVGATNEVNANQIGYASVQNNAGDAVVLNGADGNAIDYLECESNTGWGIKLTDANGFFINGGWQEGNTAGNITVADDPAVRGVYITSVLDSGTVSVNYSANRSVLIQNGNNTAKDYGKRGFASLDVGVGGVAAGDQDVTGRLSVSGTMRGYRRSTSEKSFTIELVGGTAGSDNSYFRVLNEAGDVILKTTKVNGLEIPGTVKSNSGGLDLAPLATNQNIRALVSGTGQFVNNGTAGYVNGSGGPQWKYGTGSPEGVVTAGIGSFYSRTDGGAATSFYVKESGAGNTGWVAK